jgi:starch synthase
VEYYGRLNLLKGGLVHADAITTVSERYAREIQTPEYGFGLDPVMREQSHKLTGILNGADYELWNPETDSLLPATYGPDRLEGKKTCREALLQELGLDPHPEGPVFAMVSRLAMQKGIDLLLPLIDRLLAGETRLIVLGEGDALYERDLLIASKRHPGRFVYRKSMDPQLSHLIEAGADLSLIPSHYEPCGLTAMYGLKYGELPIARATGGLFEIIQDFDPVTQSGNGFLFFDAHPEALWDAIERARRHFTHPEEWTALQRRAMATDFSWERAVQRYEAVYTRAAGQR